MDAKAYRWEVGELLAMKGWAKRPILKPEELTIALAYRAGKPTEQAADMVVAKWGD